MRTLDFAVPAGDGEILVVPPPGSWPDMVEAARAAAAAGRSEVCGIPMAELRARARAAALSLAGEYTSTVTGGAPPAADPAAPILVTGHQPVMFHPGIWIKNLLVDDLATRIGGTGINLVVDNDAVGAVCLNVPFTDAAGQTAVDFCCLVRDAQATPYESMPPPSSADVDRWLDPVAGMLETLEDHGIAEAFAAWRAVVPGAMRAGSLGDLLAMARRRYEAPLATSYLELPVSRLAGTDAFLLFAIDLCEQAPRFRDSYNAALDEYRELREIRNPANPFPDLDRDGHFLEMPFWLVTEDGTRESLFVGTKPGMVVLNCGSCVAVEIPTHDPAEALERIRAKGVALRPKALALTLFSRLFLADFFLHGIGGGKYDVVTDELMRATYGIEPPPYAVASMTLLLPVGAPHADTSAISKLEQRLSALKHNPDKALGSVGGLDGDVRALVARKQELVSAIALEGADKKALGAEIRDVNERLQAFVAPLAQSIEAEIADLKERARAAEVAQYRDWPYCFFAPESVRAALDAALETLT